MYSRTVYETRKHKVLGWSWADTGLCRPTLAQYYGFVVQTHRASCTSLTKANSDKNMKEHLLDGLMTVLVNDEKLMMPFAGKESRLDLRIHRTKVLMEKISMDVI